MAEVAEVEFTHQQVWEALDEVDSTGEVHEQEKMLAHLVQQKLVDRVADDEDGEVLYITDAGWELYEKGWFVP